MKSSARAHEAGGWSADGSATAVQRYGLLSDSDMPDIFAGRRTAINRVNRTFPSALIPSPYDSQASLLSDRVQDFLTSDASP